MAKQVIFLDASPGDASHTLVRYVMWFPIAPASQVPIAGAQSAWRGASAQDNKDLQTGAMIEELRSVNFLKSVTPAEMQAYVQTVYNQRLTERAALQNPNTFYGAFFDGSTWTGI